MRGCAMATGGRARGANRSNWPGPRSGATGGRGPSCAACGPLGGSRSGTRLQLITSRADKRSALRGGGTVKWRAPGPDWSSRRRLLLRKGPSLEAIQPPSRLQGRLVAGRKQGDDQAKRPPRRIRVDILRHVPAPVGLASLGDERGEPFAVAPRPCCAVSFVSVLRRADRLGRRTALVPARDSLSPRGIEAFPRR